MESEGAVVTDRALPGDAGSDQLSAGGKWRKAGVADETEVTVEWE